MKSENKNFLMNIGYQVLLYAIPLVTAPYVSRVLGVDNIGIYSYTYSIANMFMLFGMLGISNHGSRSIARVRDDKDELSKVFSSIYVCQSISSAIALTLYAILALFVLESNKLIACIQIIAVASVCFDVSWLFFGLEKFKVTIIRQCIVKILSLFLIFALVKTEGDLWLYTAILAGSTFASQVYLIAMVPSVVAFKLPSLKSCVPHAKNIAMLFIPVLAFSIYHILDKTMLGYMSSTVQLGYFENAEKITNIPSAVIAALGTVMLPRMANVLANKKSGFVEQIAQSFYLAMLLACTMMGGLILIAGDFSIVFFGGAFADSGPLMRILALAIPATAWANVVRTQYLIPDSKDAIYISSTIGAALVNVIINIIAIPHLGAIGACLGTVAAEYLIMIYQAIATRSALPNKRFLAIVAECMIRSGCMVLIAYLASFWIDDMVLRLVVAIVASVVAFFLVNYRFIVFNFLGIRREE